MVILNNSWMKPAINEISYNSKSLRKQLEDTAKTVGDTAHATLMENNEDYAKLVLDLAKK